MRTLFLTACAALFLAASSPSPAAAAEGKPLNLTIIAQQPGGSMYVYSTVLARMAEKYLPKGTEFEIIARGGSNVNATTLNERRGDISFSNACNAVWAVQGPKELQGEHGNHENLRSLTGIISVNYMLAAARKEFVEKTGLDTLEKVARAKDTPRFATRPATTVIPSLYNLAFDIMKTPRLDELREKGRLMQGHHAQVSEMLRDGRVDVWLDTITMGQAGYTEITLTTDMVFLPISEEVITGLQRYGLSRDVLKAGAYKGLDKDYPCPVTGLVFIAHKDVPEEDIYQFMKMMLDNLDEFVAEVPSLADWKPDREDYESDYFKIVPLHPGAARYYRERGWLK